MTARPAPGEVAFVLHTHLPYLENHGVWPVGEEWLFQAWGESWLPVTEVLMRLAEEGHRDVLTLGVTPLVAEQVSQPRLARDLGTWLGIQQYRGFEQTFHGWWAGEELARLGNVWWRHYAHLLDLHERVEGRGGLLAVWADLQARGVIELLGGPATHPYLPLAPHADLIDAQLATGLDAHAAWAGARPTGIWAPECGYRPRGPVADATAESERVDRHGTPTLPPLPGEVAGLEEFYASQGVDHFLVDAATLERANGGGDRDWTRRPDVPDPADDDPYEVVHDGVLVGDSDVVAFARDLSVAYHVWSPTAGYPGAPWYRDYFARGSFGIHPSWRVTDKELEAHEKAIYEPDAADRQARADAEHFQGVLRDVLDPRPGQLVVAAYDTELFGHWWFEGPRWLEAVLRGIASDARLRTTTLRSRLERHPPTRRLHLPESSWGYAKGHASWVTPETQWMWRDLRDAEERFLALTPGQRQRPEAAQAARELAMLQCSDWPFMVTRGNSPDYAGERFRGHLDRFDSLLATLDGGPAVDLDALSALDRAPSDPRSFLHASGSAHARA